MVNKFLRAGFIAVLSMLLLSPVMTTSAVGEEPWAIEVNDTSDAPDFVHNSVCSAGAPTGGPCTLRAAIDEANKCPADTGACEWGVIIRVPPGTYTLTIPPAGDNDNATGDLDVAIWYELPSYIIEGTDPANPPVINANGLDRVFSIDNSSTPITLRNVIVRGGKLTMTDLDYLSKIGAGISNSGILTLEDVVIEDNQISCALTNTSECYRGKGGGLFSTNQVIMNSSTVRNNAAFLGGGIFYNNSAVQMKIFNSTISGNEGAISGGGIANYGSIMLQNSTISNNIAVSYGGIANSQASATMYLYNVTIASNTATNSNSANLFNSNDSTLTISNSIIAYPISLLGSPVNCGKYGSWTALGKNLYSDATCGTGADILSNTDPKLTPLAMLGGKTRTRGLLEGSPAHDAVTGFCSDYNGYTLTIDQRGANRDAQCDLGAFEGEAFGVYLPLIRR